MYIEQRPDVTLMDLELPSEAAFGAIRKIRARDARARIIGLTDSGYQLRNRPVWDYENRRESFSCLTKPPTRSYRRNRRSFLKSSSSCLVSESQLKQPSIRP